MVSFPSMDAFTKAFKKTDPMEAVITPTAQAKNLRNASGTGSLGPPILWLIFTQTKPPSQRRLGSVASQGFQSV